MLVDAWLPDLLCLRVGGRESPVTCASPFETPNTSPIGALRGVPRRPEDVAAGGGVPSSALASGDTGSFAPAGPWPLIAARSEANDGFFTGNKNGVLGERPSVDRAGVPVLK